MNFSHLWMTSIYLLHTIFLSLEFSRWRSEEEHLLLQDFPKGRAHWRWSSYPDGSAMFCLSTRAACRLTNTYFTVVLHLFVQLTSNASGKIVFSLLYGNNWIKVSFFTSNKSMLIDTIWKDDKKIYRYIKRKNKFYLGKYYTLFFLSFMYSQKHKRNI